MSIPGGIVRDFGVLQRKYMKLEQCSVSHPVMQCHHEGCQWLEKDAEIKRLRAKVEGLEKTLADIKRYVATANPEAKL